MDINEAGLNDSSSTTSIHALRDHLEAERLNAITQAAASAGDSGAIAHETVARIGHLHLALLAVRDEIEAHTPKLGAGSEQPLS
jgi:hypothetical protein